MPAKVFGPTDSVADTLTQIGSTYQMPPYNSVIYAAEVGLANVVDAKITSGHLLIETVKRSYHFAIGGGTSGAATSSAVPVDVVDMAIPVPANSNVKVYVLTGDACVDCTISIQFAAENVAVVGKRQPTPDNFMTLAAGGVSGSGDTAADTEEAMTASAKLTRATLQPEQSGRIYQIRFAGSGVVNAKAATALIKIYVAGEAGPYEYSVSSGSGGATNGVLAAATVINIPEGIPVKVSSNVDIKITTAEIMKAPTISLSYW